MSWNCLGRLQHPQNFLPHRNANFKLCVAYKPRGVKAQPAVYMNPTFDPDAIETLSPTTPAEYTNTVTYDDYYDVSNLTSPETEAAAI